MNKIFYKTCAVVLLGFAILACGEQVEEKSSNLIIPVKAVSAKQVQINDVISTSGKVSSSIESKLSFKIPGIVKSINVKEGQAVKTGQTLASLDLSEMKANLTKAQNGFNKTQRDLERVKRLFEDEVTTLEQKQNVQTAFEVAKSDLEIAEFNFRYATIKAPADGIILMKNVEENELVNAGYPVILFGNKGANWKIVASIADVDIIKVSIGDSANVYFDAYPGISFNAKVSEVGQSADPRTGTYEVGLTLQRSQYKLASGFVAKVKIYPTEKGEAVLVPIQAVTQSNLNKGFVYLPNGTKVDQRIVTTSGIYKDMIMITAGLNAGEQVITDGVEYLSKNSQIKLVAVN